MLPSTVYLRYLGLGVLGLLSGRGSAGKGWPEGPGRAPLLSRPAPLLLPLRLQSYPPALTPESQLLLPWLLLLLLRPRGCRGGKEQEGEGTNPKPLIRDPGGDGGLGTTHRETGTH